jgi:hypothetical protein
MDLPYRSYAPLGLLQQRGATALQKPMGASQKKRLAPSKILHQNELEMRACSAFLNKLSFDSKSTFGNGVKLRKDWYLTVKLIVLEGEYYFGENVSPTYCRS